MNSELKLKDLCQALTTQEIEDGCRCLLESTDKSGKKVRDTVLCALATVLRFRPVFLQRRTAAENLPLLVKRIEMRQFERFQDDVIRALARS